MSKKLENEKPEETGVEDMDKAPVGARNIEIPRQATAEEVHRTKTRLEDLGRLFENPNINWHLDGGVCISLLEDPTAESLIRKHSDIDISLEKSELGLVTEAINKAGFAYYVGRASTEGQEKTYTRVDAEEFAKGDTGVIRPITPEGEIDRERELGFIDVHLVKRNERGNIVAFEGVELPRDWDGLRDVVINGVTVHIPNPVLTAYYKLHNVGTKDAYDLHRLAQTGVLTETDLEQLGTVISGEIEARKAPIDRMLEKTAGDIGQVELSHQREERVTQIRQVLEQQPFTADMSSEQIKYLDTLADYIEKTGTEPENVAKVFYKAFGIEDRLKQGQIQFEIFANDCRDALEKKREQ